MDHTTRIVRWNGDHSNRKQPVYQKSLLHCIVISLEPKRKPRYATNPQS